MHCGVDSLAVVREIRSVVLPDTLNHVWLAVETMPHTHTYYCSSWSSDGTVPATTRLLGYILKDFRWELTFARKWYNVYRLTGHSPCANVDCRFQSRISESAADTLHALEEIRKKSCGQ
jgi:hypothetical protein